MTESMPGWAQFQSALAQLQSVSGGGGGGAGGGYTPVKMGGGTGYFPVAGGPVLYSSGGETPQPVQWPEGGGKSSPVMWPGGTPGPLGPGGWPTTAEQPGSGGGDIGPPGSVGEAGRLGMQSPAGTHPTVPGGERSPGPGWPSAGIIPDMGGPAVRIDVGGASQETVAAFRDAGFRGVAGDRREALYGTTGGLGSVPDAARYAIPLSNYAVEPGYASQYRFAEDRTVPKPGFYG